MKNFGPKNGQFSEISKSAGPFAVGPFLEMLSIFKIIEVRMPEYGWFRVWAKIDSKLGLGHFGN